MHVQLVNNWIYTTARLELSEFHFSPAQLHVCPIIELDTETTFAHDKSNISQKIISMKTKMKLIASLKIWVVIYPSITLFLYLFGEQLSLMPLYQRTFLLTISLVPWMMFIGVPFVDSIITGIAAKKQRSK